MNISANLNLRSIALLWRRFVAANARVGLSRNVGLICWMLAALGGCFLAYVVRMHRIDHDAFHEMALFREWLVTSQFPTGDVFAYTPTVNPAVHHEWGTGAVLYFATIGTGMGAIGLAILRLLLICSLWLLLYRVARMRGAHPIVFAVTSFVVFPMLWVGFATIRAQLFTLVFIAAQMWMQELDWRGRKAWIILWLLMLAAWLNMHAGFVVGIGMMAIHFAERFVSETFRSSLRSAFRQSWHMLAAVPIALALLQLNPYGTDYIPYLIHAIRMPRPLITEWQPLWNNYAPVITMLAFVGSVVTFAYCMRRLKHLVRMRGALTIAICCYMALRHIRHGSIFSIVWIAYVPAWLSRTAAGKYLVSNCQHWQSVLVRACQVTVLATLAFATYHHAWIPSLPPRPVYSSSCYPSEAVAYLRENQFSGNVLTPFQIGAYVSWELYPQVKVSLDSRYEVAYPDHLVTEHADFIKARGDQWQNLPNHYPTDLVLIPTSAPVHDHIDKLTSQASNLEPDQLKQAWKVVYRDDSYTILANERSAHQLPDVDRRNQVLKDRVGEVFSQSLSHWNHATEYPPR